MADPAPLDPNHQLRWAIEHLPSPIAAGPVTHVSAPGIGGGQDVSVEFRRASRQHRGANVEGWLFEGPVVVDAGDVSVEAGFPGVDSWIRGKLGPYCLHLEVVRAADRVAQIRAFAATREALDEATDGRG